MSAGAVAEAAGKHLDAVAKESAENIAAEARARVARATGRTQRGIKVEEAHDGTGYVVVSKRQPMPNLPLWIEGGTVHQPARPFLHAAAALERGPYVRRLRQALGDAIDRVGG